MTKSSYCVVCECVSLKLCHEYKTYCNRNCKEASIISHKKLILGSKIYYRDYIMLLRKCSLVDICNFKCVFFANMIFCFSIYFLRISHPDEFWIIKECLIFMCWKDYNIYVEKNSLWQFCFLFIMVAVSHYLFCTLLYDTLALPNLYIKHLYFPIYIYSYMSLGLYLPLDQYIKHSISKHIDS